MHLVEQTAARDPAAASDAFGPEPAPAKEAKNKLRAAWIGFFGRILAQVIGATATLTLGILLAGRLQSVTLEAPRPAGSVAQSPAELALALLDVRQAFLLYDRDRNGLLVSAEVPQSVWQALRASDLDGDGAFSKDELYEARERARMRPAR